MLSAASDFTTVVVQQLFYQVNAPTLPGSNVPSSLASTRRWCVEDQCSGSSALCAPSPWTIVTRRRETTSSSTSTDVGMLATQQRLDPLLGRADVPGILGGELRIADRDAPEARQQPPLRATSGIQREQCLQAGAQPAAAPLCLVEACAQSIGDLAERREQQVTLVGEVVRDDRRAVPGGVGDVAERQRIQPMRAHQLGGCRRDVPAARRVIDMSGHRRTP